MGPFDDVVESAAKRLLAAGLSPEETVSALVRHFEEDAKLYPPEMPSQSLSKAMAESIVAMLIHTA